MKNIIESKKITSFSMYNTKQNNYDISQNNYNMMETGISIIGPLKDDWKYDSNKKWDKCNKSLLK